MQPSLGASEKNAKIIKRFSDYFSQNGWKKPHKYNHM